VVDAHTPFLHELFKLPIAQWVRHVPVQACEDDVLRYMGIIEARHSPSCLTLGYRGRSYPHGAQPKIYDSSVPPPPELDTRRQMG
jgi:hypothetical protein